MVTKTKRWPNNAEWARMDAIALAVQGEHILDALLDELDNVHHVRQIGRVMGLLKEIRIKLTICKNEET